MEALHASEAPRWIFANVPCGFWIPRFALPTIAIRAANIRSRLHRLIVV